MNTLTRTATGRLRTKTGKKYLDPNSIDQRLLVNRMNKEHFEKWKQHLFNPFWCTENQEPDVCVECGKKSPKHILNINIPESLLDDKEKIPDGLVGDWQILWKCEQSYIAEKGTTCEHKVHKGIEVRLWMTGYKKWGYGNFCRLRCCEKYANRLYELYGNRYKKKEK
tara:strand:- start:3388 stop:3888 length:501 start_codon:yes stop_codon:yes gene_type:complete